MTVEPRPYTDKEMMELYSTSAELSRKDGLGGGRVDSWAIIDGRLYLGISGDPCKWNSQGLMQFWTHPEGRPCGENNR